MRGYLRWCFPLPEDAAAILCGWQIYFDNFAVILVRDDGLAKFDSHICMG
jgi:hypothetical protein